MFLIRHAKCCDCPSINLTQLAVIVEHEHCPATKITPK